MPKLAAGLIAAALYIILPSHDAGAQEAAPVPLLGQMFGDHGVLQRDKPIRIHGQKRQEETVTVTLNGVTVTATGDTPTSWQAVLPAMPAGGPYTLTATASSGRSEQASDVMIGDVWLCSGQSNMEFPVSGAMGAYAEIAAANDPEVRLMTVAHDTAAAPRPNFAHGVQWQAVTPKTIGDFSAVCWFMARELRKTAKVPFGLIDASWGGTAINAWRSEASMREDPALKDQLALLALQRRDPPAAAARYGAGWQDWWRSRSGDAAGGEPWQAAAPAGGWKPVPSFTYWEQWGVPELAAYNGIVWYRTEITLTKQQAAQKAVLNFGVVDDMDVTFVNGIGVGTTTSWDLARSYPLGPKVLRPGRNVIAIAAYDSFSNGGFAGTAEQRFIAFADGTKLALPEPAQWQYRVTPGIADLPHAPWESSAGLASIYNGMIAPIGTYGLRGVAWYQGESDAGSASDYTTKLAGLMGAWRGQFDAADLPFVIVQLPDWGARVTRPAESGFSTIRDQQRRAVEADSHAGLVVTIDIGDPEDLHPANKQDVGRRAALVAQHLAYGAQTTGSGPWIESATRERDTVVLRFGGFAGDLLTYSGAQAIGFELCGAGTGAGSCRFVPGSVTGRSVSLPIGDGPAERVRFCWGDSPICNLYDATGLPAVPFERQIR